MTSVRGCLPGGGAGGLEAGEGTRDPGQHPTPPRERDAEGGSAKRGPAGGGGGGEGGGEGHPVRHQPRHGPVPRRAARGPQRPDEVLEGDLLGDTRGQLSILQYYCLHHKCAFLKETCSATHARTCGLCPACAGTVRAGYPAPPSAPLAGLGEHRPASPPPPAWARIPCCSLL